MFVSVLPTEGNQAIIMNSLPTLTPKAGESARESRGIGAQINADSNSGSLEMNLQESELAFYLICFALGLAICLVVLVCVSLLQRFQRRRREAAIENESVYAIPSKPTGDPAMLGGDAVIVGRTWNMVSALELPIATHFLIFMFSFRRHLTHTCPFRRSYRRHGSLSSFHPSPTTRRLCRNAYRILTPFTEKVAKMPCLIVWL